MTSGPTGPGPTPGLRAMTSLFLVHGDRLMLLYRKGSRAIADSWVGIGGHIEPAEHADPTAAMLREVSEETGLTAADLDDVALRYVALRAAPGELRQTYYFTAALTAGLAEPTHCPEGVLRWFGLDTELAELGRLDMPPTARVVLDHWLRHGRHDTRLRAVVLGPGGPTVAELGPQADRR